MGEEIFIDPSSSSAVSESCSRLPIEMFVNGIKYLFFAMMIWSIYLVIKGKVKGWKWIVLIVSLLLGALQGLLIVKGGFEEWLGWIFSWWRTYCI